MEGFEPRGRDSERSLMEPRLEWLSGMSEEEFRQTFRNSVIKRTKWAGLVRNACLALGNAGTGACGEEGPRIDAVLKRLEESENPTVGESAKWARARIKRS
jgi:epoxyqueuosine reductase